MVGPRVGRRCGHACTRLPVVHTRSQVRRPKGTRSRGWPGQSTQTRGWCLWRSTVHDASLTPEHPGRDRASRGIWSRIRSLVAGVVSLSARVSGEGRYFIYICFKKKKKRAESADLHNTKTQRTGYQDRVRESSECRCGFVISIIMCVHNYFYVHIFLVRVCWQHHLTIVVSKPCV